MKLSKKEIPRSCSSTSSTSPFMRNSSQRCSFTRKCASLVKEQRARMFSPASPLVSLSLCTPICVWV
uniref:Uncharacterized protein n=1 Tax=Nelumbo nucifera TaxID=4432 RepID=A0A822YWJ6_NELNU|nr:TPA_asm: hypothetical protein HUJ06_005766 [Nelumbo nucifera]